MTALFQIASPLRGRCSRKRTRRAGRPLWDVLYRLEALERRTVLSGLQIIQTQSYGPDFTDLISYRRGHARGGAGCRCIEPTRLVVRSLALTRRR